MSMLCDLVNTVRPVFESQQWPQAGCAADALHPKLNCNAELAEQQAYSSNCTL